MKGFDKEFRDLPDYILRITERIWEDRRVDAVRRYYSGRCPVRSPAGIVVGAEAVIAATLATLAEFPDRRLLGEEVVWSGCEDTAFLSSHRILSVATHGGDGAFGRATGRRVRYRVIADCVVQKNQIVEEWLVRDQGAIAHGLGMHPQQLAKMQIAAGNSDFYLPEDDRKKQYRPRMSKDDDAAAYLQLWEDLWRARLSRIPEHYAAAAMLYAPGGGTHSGGKEVDRFWTGWLSAVENAKFQAEELTASVNENDKTVAMRWSVNGAHSGRGVLFASDNKGAPLHIMGISHARIVGGKIATEWILADEVALWKQILCPRQSKSERAAKKR